MPSTTLANLALESNWPLGESGWDTGMNANLQRLDALVSPYMLSKTTDVPGAPTAGDRYIIPAAATGAWLAQDNNIARYNGTTWDIFPVIKEWIAFVADLGEYQYYNGSAWVTLTSGTSDPTKLPLAGGTMTGEIVLDEVKETVFATAGPDIDPANGTIQVVTLTQNETLTFTNLQPGQSVTIKLVIGAFSVLLTNIAKWDNDGAAPGAIAAEHWLSVSNVDGTIVGTDRKGVA